MKATRDGFGKALLSLGDKNENVVVLSADLSKATRTAEYAQMYPDRFFECGIAECNAIGIASGLLENGYYPIFSSFASFLTGKYDVIRVSAAYSNSSMLLAGTHSGMAIGKDGVTQMGLEDISLMRSLPNMKVYQPASYNQCIDMIPQIVKNSGPTYLRLGRQPVEEFFNLGDTLINKLQIIEKENDSDITIISSGCVLSDTFKAVQKLKTMNLKITFLNAHSLKPFDADTLVRYAKNSKLIVTVEDHSIVGGLGSIVAEVLSEKLPKKLLRIGLLDCFPESGDPSNLYEKYGLSSNKIFSKIKKALL